MSFEIELQNFQGFKDRQVIPVRPLTLIFGPNSSGKSSIIRSLLLTGQVSTGWNDISWVGKLVDLSSFQNTVFSHDTRLTVDIGYRLGSVRALHSKSGSFTLQNTAVRFSISKNSRPVEISFSFDLDSGPVVLWFSFDTIAETWTINKQNSKNLARLASALIAYLAPKKNTKAAKLFNHSHTKWASGWRSADYFLEDAGYFSELDTQQMSRFFNEINIPIDAFNMIRGTQDMSFEKRFQYIVLGRLTKGIMTHLNSRFSSIRHVGPSRVVSSNIESAGKGQSQYLLSDGSNLLKTLDSEKVSRLNVWLGLVTDGQYSAKIKRLPNALLGELRTLILRDNHTKSDVQLKDVGSGLSQIIPVLQNLALSQGQEPLVLLQQPELHLHPKMQAHLADLFAQEATRLRPSKNPRRPTIVVETHSENLILRIQKLIRNGELNHTDVSVLYVDRVAAQSEERKIGKKGNQVSVLELDSKGEFTSDWPTSFSDLRLNEIF